MCQSGWSSRSFVTSDMALPPLVPTAHSSDPPLDIKRASPAGPNRPGSLGVPAVPPVSRRRPLAASATKETVPGNRPDARERIFAQHRPRAGPATRKPATEQTVAQPLLIAAEQLERRLQTC